MSNSFHRVSHSLQADHGLRSSAGIVIAIALTAGWTTWAFQSRVTRYEISETARLEVDAAAYPVQASLAGRLVASQLILGREVQVGDILAEIDSDTERLSLQEERTRRATLEPQLAALRSQMQTEDQGRTDERQLLSLDLLQTQFD
jgi:hemolysin D